MVARANQGFTTAANTLDGRPMTFASNQVVPDHIAKAIPELVYDDGAKAQPTSDGTPANACPDCDFVAKSAAGLGAHARVHDDVA